MYNSIKNKKQLLAAAVLAATTAIPVELVLAQGQLEEVIVSAQRREQSLFEVPVAVTAYSAEAMQNAGIDDIGDLSAANPSFTSNTELVDPIGNAPIRIRGIGSGGGNPGFEGSVGLYVDDVYRSRTGSAMLTFFDMDGVEVLRGPQGTLFGKNTTAGAILMRTAAPIIDSNEGRVTLEAGNYGQLMGEGMVNLAISDSLAVRVALLHDEWDGFMTNAGTGEDGNDSENTGARIGIAFEPTLNFSARLTLDYGKTEMSMFNNSVRNEAFPATDGLQSALALNLLAPGGLGAWFADADGNFDPFSNQAYSSQVGTFTLDQSGVTADLTWDLSDDITVRSITGFRNIDSDNVNGDWDFGPSSLAGKLDALYEFDTFSQEFLLEGNTEVGGLGLDFVTGFNYFTEDMKYTRIATPGAQFAPFFAGAFAAQGLQTDVIDGCTPTPDFSCLAFASIGNTDYAFQDMTFDQSEDSYGVFGHATLELTDELSLIAGLRYNRIEKEIDVTNNQGDPGTYFNEILANNVGFFLAGSFLMSPSFQADRADEEWTYLTTLQYRPSDDLQLFATYSRGFKSGGFNMNENAAGGDPALDALLASLAVDPTAPNPFRPFDLENAQFDPEFVDAYELGMRWNVSDAARVAVTLFRSEYEDLQVSNFTGTAFITVNAGTSSTDGIEIEAEYAATDNLTLTGGLTHLASEYGNDVNDRFAGRALPEGRARANTPDTSVVFGARYIQPLSGDMEAFVNANVSYASDTFLSDDPNLETLEQDAYTLVTGSLGVRTLDNWSVSLWCNNCTDEEYFTYAFPTPVFNAPLFNPGTPATYGIRATKDF